MPNSSFQQSPDKPFEGQDKALKASKLVETSVSWRTGPRCPKCYDKHVEVLAEQLEKRLESRLEERSRLTDLKSSKTEKLSSNRLVKEEGGPGRDE